MFRDFDVMLLRNFDLRWPYYLFRRAEKRVQLYLLRDALDLRRAFLLRHHVAWEFWNDLDLCSPL